jgi:glyoxylase-like metal-dependent hydrolase (beta-lactamase superfamily II)
VGPLPDAALPSVVFQDSMTIWFNGEGVRLLHFGEAHTDGDAIVVFQTSHIVHMGDLFHGPNRGSAGSDMVGLARTLDEALRRIPSDAKIVTGHGDVTTVEDLKTYRVMLGETIELVRGEIADGETLTEIRARGLPERWRASWDESFMPVASWLDEIYRTLALGGGDHPLPEK